MDPTLPERLSDEISLLEAMYPDHLIWTAKSRELSYTNETKSCTFTLRLPDTYLSTSLPSVLLARTHATDVRDHLQHAIQETCQPGEECLDAIVTIFNELSSSQQFKSSEQISTSHNEDKPTTTTTTVIIWLHHLLAQSKRKLALHPSRPPPSSSPSSQINGLSKPGYPGVLVYSGPSAAVKEHVAELKGQKWQAFQVRYEEDGEEGEGWGFEHGRGIREVETMGEVVGSVVGEERREVLCGVLGIK